MSVEGKIVIELGCTQQAVDSVSIASNRPVHASQLFHGKPVAESLKMLPLLFNICGTAQACAAVSACEQALGVAVSPATNTLREQLVQMETIKEHLWRILYDWPVFGGATPDQEGMREILAIQRTYRQARCNGGEPFQIGGFQVEGGDDIQAGARESSRRLATLLTHAVFGIPPERWLEIAELAGISAWAAGKTGHAARLVHRVMTVGWAATGRCDVGPLPELTLPQLHHNLQITTYVEQPDWLGHTYETTSLTRTHSPLLEALAAEYGNGLLVRLIARLTELAQLAGALETDQPVAGQEEAGVTQHNPGLGELEAARGRLVHRVELEGERIRCYQILAPTEWNFHPRGIVAEALATLTGSRDEIEQQARLLINAIDPCVGYELSLH